MKRIYLDNSATTKQDPEVTKIMEFINSDFFGNPSSIHSFGQDSRRIIDEAREFIAFYLDCKPTEIFFTSGGSESDNLAIKGVVEARIEELKKIGEEHKPHVITSQIEHYAVLNTIKELEKAGRIEATYIKPKSNGVLKVQDVEKAIKANTVLISIMYVNNEIGTVEPIREIGKMVERVNKLRAKHKKSKTINGDIGSGFNRVFFHTDAVQAAEYFQMGMKYLHVDLLTFSAHKFYGPKGIGVLLVKEGTPIKSQVLGGSQESKLRAGTENVPAIAGMHRAISLFIKRRADGNRKEANKNLPELNVYDETKKIKKLRDKLMKGLLNIPNSRVNGCKIRRSPNNLNISFKNAEGESILLMLDQYGIAASSGSACTSGSLEPSHVLSAIGVKPEWSHGSVRFSLCKDNTEEEIDKVIEVMPEIIKKLRAMSPLS